MANMVAAAIAKMKDIFNLADGGLVPYHRHSYVPAGGRKPRRWREGKRPPGKFFSKRYFGK